MTVVFIHRDTGRRVILRDKAAARFLDNRDPSLWFTVPATADDLRCL